MHGNGSVQSLEFEVLRHRRFLIEMQELLDMREEEVRCVTRFCASVWLGDRKKTYAAVGRLQGVTHTEMNMHATIHLTNRQRTIRGFDPLLSNSD